MTRLMIRATMRPALPSRQRSLPFPTSRAMTIRIHYRRPAESGFRQYPVIRADRGAVTLPEKRGQKREARPAMEAS